MTTVTTAVNDASVTVTLTLVDPDNYYGRQLIVNIGDISMLEAYDYLTEQMLSLPESISFRLTPDEAMQVLKYYHDDHPENFWYTGGCSISTTTIANTTYARSVFPQYDCTAEEAATLRTQLEERTVEILDGITGNMSAAQRQYLVHKRLVTAAEYNDSLQAEHTQDLLGVLLNGTGVCESYSRTYQYLLYRCGIQSIQVYGNNDGSADINHIWNAVDVDGEWLLTDLTWDDNGGESVGYAFYNFTYADCAQLDHTIIVYSYPLPDYQATAA